MASTDYHSLYRNAYEAHVPELRRLYKLAWERNPKHMTEWMERRAKRNRGNPIELVGSTAEEVDDVRRMFGRPLPASYQAYLEVMGDFSGRTNPNYVLLYRWIGPYNEELVPFLQALKKEGRLTPDVLEVPQDAVFVGGHDGYDFLFLCEDGDDPQGWSLHETHGVMKLEHSDGSPFRFSEIVLRGIEASIRSSLHAWRLKDI